MPERRPINSGEGTGRKRHYPLKGYHYPYRQVHARYSHKGILDCHPIGVSTSPPNPIGYLLSQDRGGTAPHAEVDAQ